MVLARIELFGGNDERSDESMKWVLLGSPDPLSHGRLPPEHELHRGAYIMIIQIVYSKFYLFFFKYIFKFYYSKSQFFILLYYSSYVIDCTMKLIYVVIKFKAIF